MYEWYHLHVRRPTIYSKKRKEKKGGICHLATCKIVNNFNTTDFCKELGLIKRPISEAGSERRIKKNISRYSDAVNSI